MALIAEIEHQALHRYPRAGAAAYTVPPSPCSGRAASRPPGLRGQDLLQVRGGRPAGGHSPTRPSTRLLRQQEGIERLTTSSQSRPWAPPWPWRSHVRPRSHDHRSAYLNASPAAQPHGGAVQHHAPALATAPVRRRARSMPHRLPGHRHQRGRGRRGRPRPSRSSLGFMLDRVLFRRTDHRRSRASRWSSPDRPRHHRGLCGGGLTTSQGLTFPFMGKKLRGEAVRSSQQPRAPASPWSTPTTTGHRRDRTNSIMHTLGHDFVLTIPRRTCATTACRIGGPVQRQHHRVSRPMPTSKPSTPPLAGTTGASA